MAGTAQKYFYKFMNFFVSWPTRLSIEASAKKYELLDQTMTISKMGPKADLSKAAQCCCILYWDETIGRSDEPITVSSESICQKIARDQHADYRRPLIQGPCGKV
jgi:hypothetical protein